MAHPEQYTPEDSARDLLEAKPELGEMMRETIDKIQEEQASRMVRTLLEDEGVLLPVVADLCTRHGERVPSSPQGVEVKVLPELTPMSSRIRRDRFELALRVKVGDTEETYEVSKDGSVGDVELGDEQKELMKDFYKTLKKNMQREAKGKPPIQQ